MEPTSLLSPLARSFLGDNALNFLPSIIDLLLIIIPLGLALWALGLGIKRGISYLIQRVDMALGFDDYDDSLGHNVRVGRSGTAYY